MKDRRANTFCGRMRMETPLGKARTEILKNRYMVSATRSRKIHQEFISKGIKRPIQPDPQAPCIIDEFIENTLSSSEVKLERTLIGICDKCRRTVSIEMRSKKTPH